MSEIENLSKSNSIPHIRLPRSLLKDPLWIDLPLGYREVFNVILERVCFLSQKFDDHGVVIDLFPGQVCASIREITGWLGKYGDKNIVERAIKKFILYEFMRQEVRHRKLIITICHKETYDLIKEYSETRSETKLRRSRDKLETQKDNVDKEEKEEYNNKPQSASPHGENVIDFDFQKESLCRSLSDEVIDKKLLESVAVDEFNQHNIYYQNSNSQENKTNSNKNDSEESKSKQKSNKSSIPKIPFKENVLLAQEEYDKLYASHGKSAVDWMIEKLSNYKYSNGKKYRSDYHAILSWVLREYIKSTNPNQNNQSQQNRAYMNGRRMEEYDKW